MASIRSKRKVAPEYKGDGTGSVSVGKSDGSPKDCPVELFQVTMQRKMASQRQANEERSKRTVFSRSLCIRSGESALNMGIHGCPTNLFLAKTSAESRYLDLLYRRNEVDEEFKLILQTKEMNRVTKESRVDWLIEAVRSVQENSLEVIDSEDTTLTTKRASGWFHRISLRLCQTINKLKKKLRRNRVDVLLQQRNTPTH